MQRTIKQGILLQLFCVMSLFFITKVSFDFDTLHEGDVKLSLLLIKNGGLICSI